MNTMAQPATREQNPWPGLFWYTEEQVHLFFGREAETEELLRLVQRETLTVLFGRSGLGKSSLLRAGVFPRLREAGCFPVVLRFNYTPQAGSLAEQAKTLTEAAARASGIDIDNTADGGAQPTLWEYFHRIHFWGPRNDRLTPVLVFDQFEEIFTVGRRRQADTDFLEQLADLAENRIPAVVRKRAAGSAERQALEAGVPNYKIVLSLREDFVWRLDTLRPILPAIMRNRFALGPLDAARGLEIVRNAGGPWVSEEVARDIIQAVISSRQDDTLGGVSEEAEPAYLNVMCHELFERMVAAGETRITRELVATEKGGILESLYERSMSGLDDSVRQFVEQHLVTPSGFRVTVPVEEARREHISDADLEKLVDRRLLRFEDRLGTRHVELAHDLLTGLVQKSREERNRARLRRELRRARLRAAILGAVTLLGFAGTAFYWLAYMHPSVSYYARFVHEKVSIDPLRRLLGDEWRHRAESLKVTRKGFLGEVLSIKAVNGSDQCLYESQLTRSPFYSIASQHFCQLEFSYDEEGLSKSKGLAALLRRLGLRFSRDRRGPSPDEKATGVNEVGLDEQGGLVFAFFYLPSQTNSGQDSQRAFVVSADGTTILSSFKIIYDTDGNEVEIHMPGATASGASVLRIERSDRNKPKLVTGVRYFDNEGKPVAVNGCYDRQIAYDVDGDPLPPVCLDANGKPAQPSGSSQP
jgi:hypothetical protein